MKTATIGNALGLILVALGLIMLAPVAVALLALEFSAIPPFIVASRDLRQGSHPRLASAKVWLGVVGAPSRSSWVRPHSRAGLPRSITLPYGAFAGVCLLWSAQEPGAKPRPHMRPTPSPLAEPPPRAPDWDPVPDSRPSKP